MKRTKIVDVLKSTVCDVDVLVKGWVRTRRGNKMVSFIALNELVLENFKTKNLVEVLLNVNATVEAIDEFTRVANIKENIIRYIAVAE